MGKEQSPFIEELKKAEEDAQIRGVGLWNKVCVCVGGMGGHVCVSALFVRVHIDSQRAVHVDVCLPCRGVFKLMM